MRKWVIGLGVVLALGAGAAAYFWQDIQDLRALRAYANAYAPDKIDENFRSFYMQYPAKRIARAGPVDELTVDLQPGVLPEKYRFEGEVKSLPELIERTQTTGFAIYKDGKLIHEVYGHGNTRESRAIMMSVSKSITSVLIGIAYEDGDIESLDDLVTKYVPLLKGSAYDEVTIKQVLEMSSGVRWSEDYGRIDSDITQFTMSMLTGSLDEFVSKTVRQREPGSFRQYASVETQVLGMVLRGATGRDYDEYLQTELWEKVGFEDDGYILTDAIGEPMAFGGIHMRLRDMIRFGKLYLNGGKNHLGEQIVSPDWVRTSTIPDVPRLMPGKDNPQSEAWFGYKYQWWIPVELNDHEYFAMGIYGQLIYINTDRNIVIAKTSAYRDYLKDGGMMFYETTVAFQEIARHL